MNILQFVIVPILAGVIGGFVGAYMFRKTTQQNWLLENRAQVFADLLNTIEKCMGEGAKFVRTNPEPGMELERKFLDIYWPAFMSAKIARLFANEDSKEQIEKLVRQIYASHSSLKLGDKRFLKLNEAHNELQKILEDNLQKPKW